MYSLITSFFILVSHLSFAKPQLYHTECQRSVVTQLNDCPAATHLSPATTSKKYYVSITFKLNWFQAHHYCKQHGMNLATVYNKEEQDELQGFMQQNGWEWLYIGASDLGEEGRYWYVHDGAPVNYTDWYPGRPLDKDNSQGCIGMYLPAGGWFGWLDGGCNNPGSFACDIGR